MYIAIINIFTGLLGVLGTIYAVNSILKIKTVDLKFSLTWAGIGAKDEELLTQKEQARIGIALVVMGFTFESVNSFLLIDSTKALILCIMIESIMTVIIIFIIANKNKKFRKNYFNLKEE